MPATEVEFDDGHEALDGVVDLRHRQKGFGMCHKAVVRSVTAEGARLFFLGRTLLSAQAWTSPPV